MISDITRDLSPSTKQKNMTEYCGIDACRFVRGGPKETSETTDVEDSEERFSGFRAPMSAATIVESYQEYSEEFKEVIEKRLGEHSTNPPTVACSYDFNRIIGDPEKAHRVKKTVIKELSDHIEARIIFSYFKEVNEVYILGDQEHTSTTVKDFIIKHLNNSYPHIAAWKMNQLGDYELMVDHFQGKLTNAWREIDNSKNLRIYSKGDSCNPLIATSDLILSVLDEEMERRGLKLYKENVEEVLGELDLSCESDWLGDGFLSKITPRKNVNIPAAKHMAKPTFYVLKEKNEFIKKDSLLNTPRGKDLMEKAIRKEGCVKFYDENQDPNFVKDGDYFVYFNEEGKRAIELLKSSGHDINEVKFENTNDLLD